MRKAVVLALVALLGMGVITAPADAAVWYVNTGGTGDGTSWSSPFGSIQSAVNAAAADGGGEVWVAAGTYKNISDPVVTMAENVYLYGGFEGSETERSARDWETNTATIDGESARRCVIGASNATVDGFVIANGYADEYGGGVNIRDKSSMTVINCTFAGNSTNKYGGGFCVFGGSMVAVSDCTFTDNDAQWGGGGSVLNCSSANSLSGCTFSENPASSLGGGLFIQTATPIISNCVFLKNEANTSGGGICNWTNASPMLSTCTFTENSSNLGGGIYCKECAPSLEGCILSGNTASGYGGGMYNTAASPLLTDCTFAGNAVTSSNSVYGGGMYNDASSTPDLTHCIFENNTAHCTSTSSSTGAYGGGMYYAVSSTSPSLTNCIFKSNSATGYCGYGGAIYSASLLTVSQSVFLNNAALANSTHYGIGGGICNAGTLTIINSALIGNEVSATNDDDNFGGGIYNSSKLTAVNCTFTKNSATSGGGIYNSSAAEVMNCILWGDSPNEFNSISSTVVYSCVEKGYAGEQNIDANPRFSEIIPFALSSDSPCIDMGKVFYSFISEGTALAPITDIRGISRPFGGAVDMGAYEYDVSTAAATLTVSLLPEAASQAGARWRLEIPESTGWYIYTGITEWFESGKSLNLYAGEYRIQYFGVPNWETPAPQTVELTGGETVSVDMTYVSAAGNHRWLVNDDTPAASGDQDGATWATAFSSLQAAVYAAHMAGAAEIEPAEVWVAAGTYTTSSTNVLTMYPYVNVYGGFQGNEETRAARNWETNLTTLNGASSHRCAAGASYATLDGFTLTNGGNVSNGAGMCNDSCTSLTVANCTFASNTATSAGGGMYNNLCTALTMSNCTFVSNRATGSGGGMYNGSCTSLTASNCAFNSNIASTSSDGNGGGMYNTGNSPILISCTFSGNTASTSSSGNGGGMYNCNGSSPVLEDCVFSGNIASNSRLGYGGGMSNYNSCSPRLTRCNFSGNQCNSPSGIFANGGGMYNRESSPVLVDCIFENNTASISTSSYSYSAQGGGMYNMSSSSSPTLTRCTFIGNSATYSGTNTGNCAQGGGIYSHNDVTLTLIDCTFSENNVSAFTSANGQGGGIYSSSALTMNGAAFTKNTATGSGGGIYNTSSITLENGAFAGNTAGSNGGGIYNTGGSGSIFQCSLAENAAAYGGGMYNTSASPVITNCVFWGNTASTTGDELYSTIADPVVTYSCLEDWYDTGVVRSNPLFVDGTDGGDGYDLRLQAGSPCIDTGTAMGMPGKDIRGVARPVGDGYDMGAYENYDGVAASFTVASTTGEVPFTAKFSDTSTPVGSCSAWSWDFGDGGASTEQHPQHIYTSTGLYTVALTVTNESGTDTETQTDYITVTVPTYDIIFTAGAGGSVEGESEQTVETGADCAAVTAIADEGYTFTGWSGSHSGMENPLTLTGVTADMIVTANFTLNTYAVTFSAGEGGTLSGEANQMVSHGSDATAVTATPNENYSFTGWSGDYTGTENPLTLTNVTADMNVTANFASGLNPVNGMKGDYYNTNNLTGDVVVSRYDDYVNFDWSTGSPQAEINIDNFSVRWQGKVHAPKTGTYTFYTRSDDGSDLYVNGSRIINHFGNGQSEEEYSGTITLTAGNYYTIDLRYSELTGNAICRLLWNDPGTGAKVYIPEASLFTEMNQAPTGITLSDNTIDENAGANAVVCTLSTIDGDNPADAPAPSYSLVSGTGDTDNGLFNISGSALRANSSFNYATGASYSVRIRTTDNASVDPKLYYEEAFTIMVTPPMYDVVFTAGEGGSIEGDLEQLVEFGADCSAVTAVAGGGYAFTGWSGDHTGTENPLTLTNVTADMNVTANFALENAEGEGEDSPEGSIEGETPQAVDFCAAMDRCYATSQLEALALLWSLMGDDIAMVTLIRCDIADLNGPLRDTDDPPDGSADMPGPNGMLDGAYELGVLAELINAPERHQGLVTGTLPGQVAPGVDVAVVAATFNANYNTLYEPLESYLPVLPAVVQAYTGITLSPEQTEQLLGLFPDLMLIVAGYAALGDEDSVNMALFMVNNTVGEFTGGLNLTPDSFQTLDGILGPNGDADGDGFTNHQEYDFLAGAYSATEYVNAVLDPSINPGTTPEGEGEGGLEGEETSGEFTLTRTVLGAGTYPESGGTVDIEVTLVRTGTEVLTSFGLTSVIPNGWTFETLLSGSLPQIPPNSGQSGTLSFSWMISPVFPVTFSYRLNVPESSTGAQSVSGAVVFSTTGPLQYSENVITIINEEVNSEGEGEGGQEGEGEDITPEVSVWPTASAITYGQTLADSVLTLGTASVDGVFAFDAPSTVPEAGQYTAAVTFTPTDILHFRTVSGTVVMMVNKATPLVTAWPSASAITYGQTLADSVLSGSAASVGGAFTFDTPVTAPNAGNYSAAVMFTPEDTNNYNMVSGTVVVSVGKATPSVSTWPTASAITYGQTLAASTLSGGSASVAGSFSFDAPATAPNTGNYSAAMTFTPEDTNNYNMVSGTVVVSVGKATPSVNTWPTASAITYGQTLADSALSGGAASVGGAFTFDTPATAPNAGNYSAAMTFTPEDTNNYNSVSGTVVVSVGKATPSVNTWPTASAITYGQTLAASTLSGGSASVAGSFSFDAPATAPNAGSYSAAVTFTPEDTNNYNSVSGTVVVSVGKATPSVSTWPTASAITYGQTLAASTLSGGSASVAGSFSFDTPATAPNAGSYSAAVTFTPEDTNNYNTVSGAVVVSVGKAVPSVSTWPTASTIIYGQTLAASTLSGGTASVAGSFSFDAPATAPNAGNYSAAVTFTPGDTESYGSVSGTVQVTVNKAPVTVYTWPVASRLTAGQALAASTLNGGTASVAGTFAWNTPTAVLSAGIHNAGLLFTPADAANYSAVSGTVSVTVRAAAAPVASFTVSAMSGPAPLIVTFMDTSSEGSSPIDTWAWDFGDGSTSVTRNVSHTFTSAGTYSVSLTVTTYVGNNTATKTIMVAGGASDTTPPAAPIGFVLSSGAAEIRASWSPNGEVDLAGYRLYRSAMERGPYILLNPNALLQNNWYDDFSIVPDAIYWYKATAVDASGNESGPAGPLAATAAQITAFLPSLSAEAGATVRIPISVTNASGINPYGMFIDLAYDSTVLDAASITVERTVITSGVAFDINVEEQRIRISSVGVADTLVGEGKLFDIVAKVRGDAEAGACGGISYNVVKFYDEGNPYPQALVVDYSGAGEICVNSACIQGDLDANREIDSADTIVALRIAVRLIAPDDCQLSSGDLNGDGFVNSGDAVLIQRMAVGLPLNPAQHKAAQQEEGAIVMAASSEKAQPGDTVDVAVNLSDAEGLSGLELTISHDALLTLDKIMPGGLTSDFKLASKVGDGYVNIAMSNASALSDADAAGGCVAILRFKVSGGAVAGEVLPVRLNGVEIKGQYGERLSWHQSIEKVDGQVTVEASKSDGGCFGGGKDADVSPLSQAAAGDVLGLVFVILCFCAGTLKRRLAQ